MSFGTHSNVCGRCSCTRIASERFNGPNAADLQNSKDGPIYISIEPWPECFELEPGDKLTLRYEADDIGDAVLVDFINERELVVWPTGKLDQIEILFNDAPAEGRSWTFQHK